MERAARSFWDQLAQRWCFPEPLTPSQEDIDWYQRQVARRVTPPARAVLFGVTPGIAAMRWPAATTLTAVDWSREMLKIVWPARNTPPSSCAACADWRELPIASGSLDLVVGDGCYAVLSRSADAALVNAEMRRALKPRGFVLMRCFCRPTVRPDLEDLFQRLFAGEITNLDLFRFLLAMALYKDAHTQVTRRAVGEVWKRYVPDARAMQARMGWTDDGLANMERSAASANAYYFPTLEELAQLWRPHFETAESSTPAYAWGELFPRVVLRAR
jgi:SAM-dependent methyltransferase